MFAALVCGGVSGTARAAGKTFLPPTDPGSGVKIEVVSWLDACPPSGMAPFVVKITNSSGSAHNWTFSLNDTYGGGMVSKFRVHVPPGRSAEVPFTAAVATQLTGGYHYRSLNITVEGHGTRGHVGQLQHPDSISRASSSTGSTPFLAMSAQLSTKGWSALNDKFDKASGSKVIFDATQVDVEKAPEDWRGYLGLAQLWMTDGEWSAMGSGAKAAMLEWVALGGRAVIFTTDATDARINELKLPPPDAGGLRRIGVGTVATQRWDGNVFPVEEAAKLASTFKGDPMPRRLANYSSSAWKLRDAVSVPALQAALVFGFIVAFGILVGPVNLFWFAGPKRRQRLFWTTPLISLAGSALLVALMVLQDGIGGSGARRVLALMLPEQNRLVLMQEQISRTGVLLNRSFAVEEPAWMQQISLDTTSASFSPYRNTNQSFQESDQRVRSGDWFKNRAVQAQVAQAVRPSRGHIEVFAGEGENDAPAALSTLDAPLENVFIKDEKNRWWHVSQLGTGEKQKMKPSTEGDFMKWLEGAAAGPMGPLPKAALTTASKLSGHAYAESAEAAKFAVKTLPSIRWNDDRVVFAGPYVRR